MAYENIITVTGGVGTVTREFQLMPAGTGVLVSPIIQLLSPVSMILSAILTPSGFSASLVGGVARITIPNNLAVGKYEVRIPNGVGTYIPITFTVETFKASRVTDE